MSMRIPGGGVSNRNPFGANWAGNKPAVQQTVGAQVQDTLFGKPKPPVLNQDDADCAALLARLHSFRKRLARLAGDQEDDYRLLLSEGTIAMIDGEGTIYVGKQFLLSTSEQVDLQVGVLAHEVGHRPKRWGEYKQQRELSKEEMNQLCRTEETRADYFSGRALAELGLQANPLIAFLKSIQVHPHPEYFPAHIRAEVILDGYNSGKRQTADRKKFFPEFARNHGAKGDLGSG